MGIGRAISLGAAVLTVAYGAKAPLCDQIPFDHLKGPEIRRDSGGTLLPNKSKSQPEGPLSSLLFSGENAYHLQSAAYVVTTEGIKDGLEWSPNGDALQVVSLHIKRDGGKVFSYGQVNYYGRDEKRVTAHFKTPLREISSELEEVSFRDHFTQAVLLSGTVGLVELRDRDSRTLVKIDTKSGRILESWILNEESQLLVDPRETTSGVRKAYVFHREKIVEDLLRCALHDIATGEKTPLRDNTRLVGMLPGGWILLVQPIDGARGKGEKVVYNGEVLTSYDPNGVQVPSTMSDKPDFELVIKEGGRVHVVSNVPPPRDIFPSELNLGLAEMACVSPGIFNKPSSLEIALFNSSVVVVRSALKVNARDAYKKYEDALEVTTSEKRAAMIADALSAICDTGADFSILSDQQIKDLIKSFADLSSLRNGVDLFNGEVKITRHGTDLEVSFKTRTGHTFNIVPGGFENIPPK